MRTPAREALTTVSTNRRRKVQLDKRGGRGRLKKDGVFSAAEITTIARSLQSESNSDVINPAIIGVTS